MSEETPANIPPATLIYESTPESTEEFLSDPTTQVLPETDPQFLNQSDQGLPDTPSQTLAPEQRWIWVWNGDIDRGRYPGDPDAPPLPEANESTGRWIAMTTGVPQEEE